MSAGRLLAERNFQDRLLSDSRTEGFSSVLRDQWAWRTEGIDGIATLYFTRVGMTLA